MVYSVHSPKASLQWNLNIVTPYNVIGIWMLHNVIRIELYSSGNRIISPENQNFYNISITLHGFLMIFFLVMPGLFGGFGNYFVPIFQGSPEVVYPRVNNFWGEHYSTIGFFQDYSIQALGSKHSYFRNSFLIVKKLLVKIIMLQLFC